MYHQPVFKPNSAPSWLCDLGQVAPPKSESQTLKTGGKESSHGHVVGVRTEPSVTWQQSLSAPEMTVHSFLPENSQLLLSLSVIHTKL